MFRAVLYALGIWSEAFVHAITVNSTDDGYTVDTGSSNNFVVSISSSGDITSLKFSGTDYQSEDSSSQIASGLGTATNVSYTETGMYSCTSCGSTRPDRKTDACGGVQTIM